jgi:hypothetical protein
MTPLRVVARTPGVSEPIAWALVCLFDAESSCVLSETI